MIAVVVEVIGEAWVFAFLVYVAWIWACVVSDRRTDVETVRAREVPSSFDLHAAEAVAVGNDDDVFDWAAAEQDYQRGVHRG